MKDTAFFVRPAKRVRLPVEYRPSTGKLVLFDDAANTRWGTPPAFPGGDAGLVSTVNDYFAFSQFILQRGRAGNRRLLSEHR